MVFEGDLDGAAEGGLDGGFGDLDALCTEGVRRRIATASA